MTKCLLVTLVALQAICGSFARPEHQHLSEKQITRLKEVASQWKDVMHLEKEQCDHVCTNKDFMKTRIEDPGNILRDFFSANPEAMTATEEKFVKFATQCAELKPDEKDEFIKSFKFNSIGSWPAFEERWDESKFNLPLAIAEMHSYNYPIIFSYEFTDSVDYLVTHFKISKQALVDIDQKRNLLKTKFETLGVKNPEEVLTDAAFFEKTVKEAAKTVESDADYTMNFFELVDYIEEMDWEEQVEVIFGRKLHYDYPVILKSRDELKTIYTAVSKLSPKVIANYFFCVFVDNIKNRKSTQATVLFIPVVKEAILKHLYSKSTEDSIKHLYITFVEIFSKLYRSDQIFNHLIRYINEDIFEPVTEEQLADEFKKIRNDRGCMANYHDLLKLDNKRSFQKFFRTRNAFVSEIKSQLMAHFFYVASLIDEPLTVKFDPLMLAMVPTMLRPFMNQTNYANENRDCFAKGLKQEIADRDINVILGSYLSLQAFDEWSRNYPDVVQGENEILNQYDLSPEKILILSLRKHFGSTLFAT